MLVIYQRIITAVEMSDCNHIKSSLPYHYLLYGKRCSLTEQARDIMRDNPYRSILGTILYQMTRTKQNLLIATSILGKFQNDPGKKIENATAAFLIPRRYSL